MHSMPPDRACMLLLQEGFSSQELQRARHIAAEVERGEEAGITRSTSRAVACSLDLNADLGPQHDTVYMSRSACIRVDIDFVNLTLYPRNLHLKVGQTLCFQNVAEGCTTTSGNTVCLQIVLLDEEEVGQELHWELDSLPPPSAAAPEWTAGRPGHFLVHSEVYPFILAHILVTEVRSWSMSTTMHACLEHLSRSTHLTCFQSSSQHVQTTCVGQTHACRCGDDNFLSDATSYQQLRYSPGRTITVPSGRIVAKPIGTGRRSRRPHALPAWLPSLRRPLETAFKGQGPGSR